MDFLFRHVSSADAWPYQQIEPIDWRMVWPVFHKANAMTPGAYSYSAMAHRMPKGFNPDFFAMTEPIHPFGHERSAHEPGGSALDQT